MAKFPKYINCKNRDIEVCIYYMSKSCPETCAYARDVREWGVGAMRDTKTFKKLEDLADGGVNRKNNK